MKFKSVILLLAVWPFAELFSQSSGQNYTISPYSNFGPGEILNQNLMQAGAQSQTWSGAYSYSLLNPATLSYLKYTTLDFAFSGRTGAISSGDQTKSFRGGSLNYMSLGFQTLHKNIRVKDSVNGKRVFKLIPVVWNSYVSLYPSTSVGYNYTYESKVPFLTSTAHSGKGGINAVEWGNGFRVGRHVSLGYSIGNLFGQMTDKSLFTVPDSTQYDIVDDEKSVNIRGWQQTAGALYSFRLDSTYHRFGLSYRWHSGMRAQTSRLTRTLEYTTYGLEIADTVLDKTSSWQSFTMPVSFGAGYYFQYRNLFGIGLDYRKQRWGNYAAFFQPSTSLTDRTDYGVGITLFPNDEKSQQEKRMKAPVRFGGRYSTTQNAISSTNGNVTITEQSVYVGFGIPITRRYFDSRVLRSIIHVQFDYLQRGKSLQGLAYERYLMLTVGINAGDVWFQRRKFD